MIPEGHTIEDIKKREQIIRDFYRELKEKSISCEMLNFCPLCVAEVYALRCDAMLAGTSRYPLHRPATTYCLCCIRYAVFLYLQNLHLPTSKRCIKMGIPSLNSAILYNVSLYFHSNRTNITNIPDSRP